jgi:hypothetical protein
MHVHVGPARAVAAVSVKLSDDEVAGLEELYQPDPATIAFT